MAETAAGYRARASQTPGHPQHYEIYHLHVILEKPVCEVARTLGVNAGQVYLAKHRVSRLVRMELRRLRKTRE